MNYSLIILNSTLFSIQETVSAMPTIRILVPGMQIMITMVKDIVQTFTRQDGGSMPVQT